MDLLNKISQTKEYIQKIYNGKIDWSIVLGSGLANFAKEIDVIVEIEYSSIPHFPISTVKGHDGKIIIGKINDKTVICQSGRFHYYEGYSIQEVTYPIRVFKSLGVENLIVTNASGGLNPNQEIGDIVVINDHINLLPEHPLRGKNHDSLGPRFVDMLGTYNQEWIDKALKYAKNKEYRAEKGVYVGVQGPTYETPSEYKFYHIIGGDCVGMSTVAEVIVARHMNMKVFGASIISDCGYPFEKIEEVNHDYVLKMVEKAEPKVTDIVKYILSL